MQGTRLDEAVSQTWRPPHRVLRDAIRRTGCNLSAICIQTKVTREQLAALLRGKDDCKLGTLYRVADRLAVSLRIDVRHMETKPDGAGPVLSIVDIATRR